jgi:hypothetical protein
MSVLKLTPDQRLSVYHRLARLLEGLDPSKRGLAYQLAPQEGAVLERMRELEPDLMAEEDAKRAVVEVDVPATRKAKMRRLGMVTSRERNHQGPGHLLWLTLAPGWSGLALAGVVAIATPTERFESPRSPLGVVAFDAKGRDGPWVLVSGDASPVVAGDHLWMEVRE